MIGLLALSVLATLLSALLILLLRRWSRFRAIVAIPGDRSSHQRPTPVGAGLAIVAVVTVGGILHAWFQPALPWLSLAALFGGALLISAVSWVDDVYTYPIYRRLFVHCLGAALVILATGFWDALSVPVWGELKLGWIGAPLTFLWIVGLTNAYNFMDGIDGIAGAQAVAAGLAWVVFGSLSGQPFITVLGLLLMSASLGFLVHNWSPAAIFMGDVGSAFLGYTFAALAVLAARTDVMLATVGILVMWPFVFDTFLTFLRRLFKGEDVLQAHRTHLYQRLATSGRSHRFVSLVYVLGSLCCTLAALAWYLRVPGGDLLAVLVTTILPLAFYGLVRREERRFLRPQSEQPPGEDFAPADLSVDLGSGGS
jgi:UDP-N-acetylmuramyl pentapeptide phosphotransferase/UDP-N-acetylglucosamine-1-phosphate transferase